MKPKLTPARFRHSRHPALPGLIAIALVSFCASTPAATIPLVNPGFEQPGTVKILTGFDVAGANDVPGWTNMGTTFGDSGVETTAGHVNSVGGWNAYLHSTDGGAYQATSYTIAEGDQFTLNWLAGPTSNGARNTAMTVTLFRTTDNGATRTVIATSSANLGGTTNTFQSYTLNYTAVAADAGARIGIAFDYDVGSNYAGFDNFSLTVAGASSISYWDVNGTTAGAGGTAPGGNWSDSNWSASSTGDVATTGWTPGKAAVFAAGTDATGSYVVTLTGTQSAASVGVQEGTVELSGGSLSLSSGAILQADAGASLKVSSALAANDLTTSGNVLLNGVSTVSGGLQINSNTLTLGSPLSVGDLTGSGNLDTGGQSFTAGAAADATYSGVVSGAGTFTKQGAGKLQLANAASSFSGNLTVNAGILETGAAAGAGVTSYLGAVSGARVITVNSAGTLRYLQANVFGGSGKTAATVPAIVADGGTVTTLRFNTIGNVTLKNGGSLANASTETNVSYGGFQFLGDVSVTGSGAGTTIQNTAGTRPDHLLGGATTTFTVADITGTAAADLTVGSVLANGSGDYPGVASLTKAGAGTMALAAANTYTGDTTISAGTLSLASPSLADGADVRIAAGATLDLTHSATDTIDELYLNGTQQVSGTWGGLASSATHKTARITGTGILQVTTGPAVLNYEAWAAQGGLTAGVNDGLADDPDGDGRSNLVEFAFDGHPLSGATDLNIVARIGAVGSERLLTLSLPVRNGTLFGGSIELVSSPPVDGVVYHLQGSVDLQDWSVIDVDEVTGPDAALIQTGMPAPDPGWTNRTFCIPGSDPGVSGNNHIFIRAKVEGP